ncbi:unnamed protein product, partial [Rotaria sp. Silwood1]
MITPKITINNM